MNYENQDNFKSNNFEIDAYFYYLVGKIDTYWK